MLKVQRTSLLEILIVATAEVVDWACEPRLGSFALRRTIALIGLDLIQGVGPLARIEEGQAARWQKYPCR